jgi:hypothetical protein
MQRFAIVYHDRPDTVARYLPANYSVLRVSPDEVLIGGADVHGWTLDGYVIPRLASGLIRAEEVDEGGDPV